MTSNHSEKEFILQNFVEGTYCIVPTPIRDLLPLPISILNGVKATETITLVFENVKNEVSVTSVSSLGLKTNFHIFLIVKTQQ